MEEKISSVERLCERGSGWKGYGYRSQQPSRAFGNRPHKGSPIGTYKISL